MRLGDRTGNMAARQSRTYRHHEPSFRKIKSGGKEWIKEEMHLKAKQNKRALTEQGEGGLSLGNGCNTELAVKWP